MGDYLMRDDAPLSEEEWSKLDEAVNRVAKKQLVGRQFIQLVGPLGAGVQTVAVDSFHGTGAACKHEITCESGCCDEDECAGECETIHLSQREYLTVPLFHKDFKLLWRDLAARDAGHKLDLTPAMMASAAVAQAEDKHIFDGLLNTEGHSAVKVGDWSKPEQAYKDIMAAVEKLVAGGCFGSYAAVLSPSLYTKLYQIVRGHGKTQLSLVEKVTEGGVFQSPMLTDNTGVVVAHEVQYMDIAVAQDLVTAYMGDEQMDHLFRVFESLVLRVRKPEAICVLS